MRPPRHPKRPQTLPEIPPPEPARPVVQLGLSDEGRVVIDVDAIELRRRARQLANRLLDQYLGPTDGEA